MVETRKLLITTVWSMAQWRQVQGTFETAEEGTIPITGYQELLPLFFSPVCAFALSRPQQPHWTSLAALRPKEVGQLGFPPAPRLRDASARAGDPRLWFLSSEVALFLTNLGIQSRSKCRQSLPCPGSFPFIQIAFCGFHRNDGFLLGPSLWKL